MAWPPAESFPLKTEVEPSWGKLPQRKMGERRDKAIPLHLDFAHSGYDYSGLD